MVESFYFVAQPFFRSNSLVEEGSRSCFWSSFVKGNRCRKIWCKKSAEKSFSEHILALSIMYTFTYVSIAFFLFSERTFVQSMIHNGLSIVKISEEFLGYLGFYWEWKMDVLYVFLYILIFFLSFLYLYVCLSRKGFIRLDTFLNGLLNIWKLIWSIINVLAFETKICNN